MTENKRFTIENIGNMFRVLDNTEPITTKFENWDRDDVKNLVELLNDLNDENDELKQRNSYLCHQLNILWRLIEAILK